MCILVWVLMMQCSKMAVQWFKTTVQGSEITVQCLKIIVQRFKTSVHDARIANNGLFDIGNLLHLIALQASNSHWWLLACC